LYKIAKQSENKYLKDINLFDVYTGDKLSKGKKSYAISFILQDKKQTLKDSQIDKIMSKIQKRYETELGAVLR
jgi:phenylalanyl-tRNA synthetase beta chain